jgi:hypothetical protein
MPRNPTHFRQLDITRALKAAARAGVTVDKIEIAADGTISLKVSRDRPAATAGAANEWDTVLYEAPSEIRARLPRPSR